MSNKNNKRLLINLLTNKFKDENYQVENAIDDADFLIVNTAIQLSATNQSVAIVGEDIDLLILLIALTPQKRNIYFIKPAKGKTVSKRIYSANCNLDDALKKNLLFLHAFSGCDTVSSFFQFGKLKHIKLLQKREDISNIISVFYDENATFDSIAKAGQIYILALYGAPEKEKSLNEYRYKCFTRSTTKK